ncbi:hypothetical protein JKP88DRAFT_254152 [Tribonema minus]|uniref:Uncharacterized protein n=1 Tax=Tribonema minus TaxID=303371 RepID=A0A835ZDS5_9STRA|nr:hypothetical protein JKP88DRAFT_254152 [Tribonema minus]
MPRLRNIPLLYALTFALQLLLFLRHRNKWVQGILKLCLPLNIPGSRLCCHLILPFDRIRQLLFCQPQAAAVVVSEQSQNATNCKPSHWSLGHHAGHCCLVLDVMHVGLRGTTFARRRELQGTGCHLLRV